MTELTGGTGYARRDYVAAFLETGKFPGIHWSISEMLDMIPVTERRGLIDLGACTGLLTVKAAQLGFQPAIGLESNEQDIQVFNTHLKRPGVRLVQQYVDPAQITSMNNLSMRIRDNNVTTILARRALPEILGDTGEREDLEACLANGERFASVLRRAGVKYLVIEGRARTKRAVHALNSLDREIEAMSSQYEAVAVKWQCAILRAK